MELVDGKTVRELLAGDPPPLRKAPDLAAQLAEALSVAHARGIVHRDLKPENLMVTPRDASKVLDFGIAKRHDSMDRRGRRIGFTRDDGSILGTVGYMSPEQAVGRSLACPRRTNSPLARSSTRWSRASGPGKETPLPRR